MALDTKTVVDVRALEKVSFPVENDLDLLLGLRELFDGIPFPLNWEVI